MPWNFLKIDNIFLLIKVQLYEEGNINPKHWYILMFIFLYERTFLFLSDDVHNKL